MVFALDLVVAAVLLVAPVTFVLPAATQQALLDLLMRQQWSAAAETALPFASSLATWLFVALCVWKAYAALQAPFSLVRTPNEPRRTRGQRPSEFPPPFPNGWFALCISDELKKGAVREVQVLGKHLVLFRTMEGKVGLLDAFCPHLGANLGVAGEVRGDCLKCCFHGWEFSTEGVCQSIPGTSAIPPTSGIRSYRVVEANHMILYWHHADGGEPWDVEELPELSDGSWWYESGRTWCHVNAHAQELPENGADAAHLNVLHKAFVWERLPSQVTHLWSVAWQPNPKAPHKSDIFLQQGVCIFGWVVPGTRVDVEINQLGPGLVRLRLNTVLGPIVTFECVTPHRTTTLIVRHIAFCSPLIPRFVGKFVLWALEYQFQRDAPIWETKKYESRPVVSKADGPIMAFRRWFQQFYTPSSVSFSDALAKEHMMDW